MDKLPAQLQLQIGRGHRCHSPTQPRRSTFERVAAKLRKRRIEKAPDSPTRDFEWGETTPRQLRDFFDTLVSQNPDSGGPEVLEAIIAAPTAQPRSLQTTCRLVIRRHLSRPILVAGNVSTLPISGKAKRYVAMETVEMEK